MREYSSREEAERDYELDLRIIWKCNKCGRERVEISGYNEGGDCYCGGGFEYCGESYHG